MSLLKRLRLRQITERRIALLLVAALGLIIFLYEYGFPPTLTKELLLGRATRATDQSLSITGLAEVTITNYAGRVTVIGDPQATFVRVHAVTFTITPRQLDAFHVNIQRDRDRIVIQTTGWYSRTGPITIWQGGCGPCRVDYEITVPATVDSLSIVTNTLVSPVQVTNVTGRVTVQTSSAPITIADCNGSVRTETWDGKVDVHGGNATVESWKNVRPPTP